MTIQIRVKLRVARFPPCCSVFICFGFFFASLCVALISVWITAQGHYCVMSPKSCLLSLKTLCEPADVECRCYHRYNTSSTLPQQLQQQQQQKRFIHFDLEVARFCFHGHAAVCCNKTSPDLPRRAFEAILLLTQ